MYFYPFLIIGIVTDLISKYIAYTYLQDKISIFNDYLFLKYIENKGIAFSISIPFLKLITIILISLIFYYYFREEKNNKNRLVDISFGLILAGAIGNGYERVFNGYVIDFIGIKYFSIFNFADIFITIGAILYIIYLFKNKKI